MDKIAVIMSCYKGEKYIREQIDSILNQRNVEVSLFIRDDLINDPTLVIIDEYTSKYDNVYLVSDNFGNCKPKKSFLLALKYVVEKFNFDYFSFADQDDYWLDEKIYSAIEKMKVLKNQKPTLYYSNKTFVDKNLKLLKEENITYYGDYIEAMNSCLASGCTMVFNRQLAVLALRKIPTESNMHDGWIYRIAKSIDSNVIFDSKSYIKYRQHENNVCGIESCKSYNDNLTFAIKNISNDKVTWRSKEFAEIKETFSEELTLEAKSYIDMLLNYRTCKEFKRKLMNDKNVKKRGFKYSLVWKLKILLNKL